MKLYTICIDQRPILVMSTNAVPPSDQRNIDEALDTWLGCDLQTLTHGGIPLWNGDPARLHIREAKTHEAQRWHASLKRAIDAGEEEAGEEDWLVYLVPISDPMDDDE